MLASAPKDDISRLSPDVITYSNGPILLAKTAAIYAVALLTVLLRSYVRRFVVRSFGRDDWTMLAALLFATICFASYVYEISQGVGKHVAVIQADVTVYRQILKARQLHMIAAVVGMSLAKISVCFFLLRLTVSRLYTYFLWGLVIFTTCFMLACAGTLIFQCIPVAAVWDDRLRPPPYGTGHARCFTIEAFNSIGLFNGIINISTDFILALLPIPLIWTLTIDIRSRLLLIVILGLGLFTAIAGVMRQLSMAQTSSEEEPWIHDTYAIWNFIELDLGIIAASLPATKPLISRIFDAAKSLTKKETKHPIDKDANGYARRSYPLTPVEQSARTVPYPVNTGTSGSFRDVENAFVGNHSAMSQFECKGKVGIMIVHCTKLQKG